MGSFHELIAGFHNFQESYLLKEKEFFDQLAHGQKPKSLVIACCDSRVDPAILLGGKPGDLFVVRSIAALIPPVGLSSQRDAVMSAVEYGVKHLDVDHLIVMGHSACGGIHAALFPEKIKKEFFLSRWVQMAHPVSEELRRELTAAPTPEVLPDPSAPEFVRRVEEGTVLQSIENLLSYDWIEAKVQEGTLSLHALYYDLKSGTLYVWNAEKEDFEPSQEHHCPKETSLCHF